MSGDDNNCIEAAESEEVTSMQTEEENVKTTAQSEGDKPLSRRQMKRMKKAEDKLKHRAEWRAKEREKKKARLKAKKEQGIDLGPSRKRLKSKAMKNSNCRIKVAVDCSFDSLMSDKQVNDLVQQLQFCYSSNRRAKNPLQFFVTGVADKTLKRLEQVGHYKSWDINFETEDYLKAFPKEEVVYLSSESDNVLHTLDDNHVYIIGGLVDYNHHKGVCHKLAVEREVQHARLPIDEYLKLQTRKVLTINHVFDILLNYTERQDWKEAFLTVIPPRKGAKAITQSEDTAGDANLTDLQQTESQGDKTEDDLTEETNRNTPEETSSSSDDQKVCTDTEKSCHLEDHVILVQETAKTDGNG